VSCSQPKRTVGVSQSEKDVLEREDGERKGKKIGAKASRSRRRSVLVRSD
jgi:hypothetical protein